MVYTQGNSNASMSPRTSQSSPSQEHSILGSPLRFDSASKSRSLLAVVISEDQTHMEQVKHRGTLLEVNHYRLNRLQD